MPEGKHKSGTYRKAFVKTPGGKTAMHYRRKKPAKAHCASCGKVLSGVPHGLSYQIRALPKTQRRPERPYGGVLCSPCMRAKFVEKIQNA